MAAEAVSDQDRNQLEAELLAGLIAVYLHRHGATLAKLGNIQAELNLSPAALVALRREAHDVANTVQSGVNKRISAAQNAPDPGEAVQQAKNGMHDYNRKTLLPYLVRFAATRGNTDAYARTPSTTPGVSMRDAILWDWERTSGCTFSDPCGDAQDASPASYDTLVSIAGGEPPLHRSCACGIVPHA